MYLYYCGYNKYDMQNTIDNMELIANKINSKLESGNNSGLRSLLKDAFKGFEEFGVKSSDGTELFDDRISFIYNSNSIDGSFVKENFLSKLKVKASLIDSILLYTNEPASDMDKYIKLMHLRYLVDKQSDDGMLDSVVLVTNEDYFVCLRAIFANKNYDWLVKNITGGDRLIHSLVYIDEDGNEEFIE